jgi:phospholipase/carboxylesterase
MQNNKNITAGEKITLTGDKTILAGHDLATAGKVVIMVHGRGGTAEDILTLADYLPLEGYALLAPRADGNSWYPYSFMAPPAQNQPWLGYSLDQLQQLLTDIRARGITDDKIYFLGFSQGACLTLEFVTRNATRYGGVVAFTGGLIGDRVYPDNYKGDFGGTPVFIGTSDPDPHVPVPRVHATTAFLKNMNAAVTEKIYPGMGHTISTDEIREASLIVFGAPAPIS